MNTRHWMKRFCDRKLMTLLSVACISVGQANESGFDATIPVLDMEEYSRPETKDQFVKKLYDALKEVGFFAVINTGVDPDTLDGGYQACFDFFSLPFEDKMKAHDPLASGQRGYTPGESAKGSGYGDFKEFYHVGREGTSDTLRSLGLWKNIWPEDVELKKPLVRLFKALEECAHPLGAAMAEAIGMPDEFFINMTKNADVLLRALHYPSSPPTNRLWAAEHTDIDLFTILPRATADGLQVKNRQGEWIDIRVPDGAFIINAGDMLENITNGEFRSGLHRVVAKEDGYERYSIVFFVHPRSQVELDPLPACVVRTGGERKYPNATRLELLAERLADLGLASPSMLEFLASSGLMERQIELGRPSVDAMKMLKEAGLASPAVLAELNRFENK